MTGDLIKNRHLHTDMCTGRTGVVRLQAQERQILPTNHQKAREKPGTGFSHGPLSSQLCQHLDLRPLASRMVRQDISIVSAAQFVVVCYSHLRKQIYFDS